MSKNFYNEILGREINFLNEQETSTPINNAPLGYHITKDNSNQMEGIYIQGQGESYYKNTINLQGKKGEGFHYYFAGEASDDGDILVSGSNYAAAAPISFTATNAIGGNGVTQIKNSILLVNEQSATPAADQSANFIVMKYKTI